MTIKDYAKEILKMNHPQKTLQAIAKLQHGLKHEEKWNDQHRKEVSTLIAFLQSGDADIENIDKY